MCRLFRNCGASTPWNSRGLSRPVAGKHLYLYESHLKMWFVPPLQESPDDGSLRVISIVESVSYKFLNFFSSFFHFYTNSSQSLVHANSPHSSYTLLCCTLSLTLVLDGGGQLMSQPCRFTPRKETRYPLYRRLCVLHGRFG